MGPDSLYCGKWRKISKSRRDLDFGPKMPSIELVRFIFIYYNVFKFIVLGFIDSFLSYRAKTQKHRNTETQTLMSTISSKGSMIVKGWIMKMPNGLLGFGLDIGHMVYLIRACVLLCEA